MILTVQQPHEKSCFNETSDIITATRCVLEIAFQWELLLTLKICARNSFLLGATPNTKYTTTKKRRSKKKKSQIIFTSNRSSFTSKFNYICDSIKTFTHTQKYVQMYKALPIYTPEMNFVQMLFLSTNIHSTT